MLYNTNRFWIAGEVTIVADSIQDDICSAGPSNVPRNLGSDFGRCSKGQFLDL